MLLTRYSIETTAGPEYIWDLWTDVKNWNKWDHGLEMCDIYGKFQVGAKGWLKPKGGPKFKFEILEVEYLKKFKDRSNLPLTKLDFTHKIEKIGDIYLITHEVEMTGVLTFFFSRIIGKSIKNDLPHAMKNLVTQAEFKSKNNSKL